MVLFLSSLVRVNISCSCTLSLLMIQFYVISFHLINVLSFIRFATLEQKCFGNSMRLLLIWFILQIFQWLWEAKESKSSKSYYSSKDCITKNQNVLKFCTIKKLHAWFFDPLRVHYQCLVVHNKWGKKLLYTEKYSPPFYFRPLLPSLLVGEFKTERMLKQFLNCCVNQKMYRS